ncbi:type 1 glutamine amidotransferase [Sulfitobacter sp. M57]|uniref:type 1 glutamine amidotransferase n=1 Tax=unclassified Sulfitobacter TaxID=196795 RepID=UPI0023E1CDE6|nr:MULTISPECIES: type 1 glutamine amidotransferase [unclassified Sulfitobacter]MDF3414258.1 type 1 glutamine amidotransferase [Sulfitobacter sp. KE5]MDF3420460.1 type 1 glutamine amidotransferase [Sulfitobacter sp. KE43]MDF3432804.1 type 1 glutamine amidotransferase [Sulfitobacter sp. KE42]MDF3458444.1 type 1 glutamine amidotransferase [Sulfitobacter sp. S74]MDF3462344.1 type 1 glutamine amidotransferase [Sulfitobacter sp. Ks18]
MKIGILITGHPPEELSANGHYDAYFQRLLGDQNFTYQAWSLVDGDMPDNVQDADGWLITGSRHGAYETHSWIPPLEQFIRDCYAAKVPMIGVCFGHQIIAQAMGGTVEKFAGGWSVGAVDYALEGDTVTINAWHQDQVVTKPAEAEVIGATDFCANAALLYGDTFWTIQPHPEYDHAFIDGLLEYRGKGLVPDPQIEAAKSKLDTKLDREKVAARMTEFFMKERA